MLGETYFRRAFRLSYGSFLELHHRLSNAVSAASRKYMSALPHHVPNGKITTSVRLGCALATSPVVLHMTSVAALE